MLWLLWLIPLAIVAVAAVLLIRTARFVPAAVTKPTAEEIPFDRRKACLLYTSRCV